MMDIKVLKEKFDINFNKTKEYLSSEFNKIRSGRVSPSIFDKILVNAYDNMVPIKEIGMIQVLDARNVNIKLYDKNLVKELASAISNSNLGVNPVVDDGFIRISFPQITEEVRMKNVKQAKVIFEQAKNKIRTIREDLRNELKKTTGLSEDLSKQLMDELDKLTKEGNSKLQKMFDDKEAELLKL